MKLASDIDLTSALTGGVLIGLTSTLYLALNGRITGLSGIFEEVCLNPPTKQKIWAWSYAAGLVSAGALLRIIRPNSFGDNVVALQVDTTTPVVVLIGGFLTGLGARLGKGCTSGHGVCGLGRLSPRSLAAVGTFMTTGVATASILRRLTPVEFASGVDGNVLAYGSASLLSLGVSLAVSSGKRATEPSQVSSTIAWLDNGLSYGFGLAFGLCLGISGMLRSDRVLNFLDPFGPNGWDPSLTGVMGGAVLFNMITFPLLHFANLPVLCQPSGFQLKNMLKIGLVPENLKIDWKLLVGSAIFGVGWGLTGICPGPGLVSIGGRIGFAKYYMPGLIGGVLAQSLLF